MTESAEGMLAEAERAYERGDYNGAVNQWYAVIEKFPQCHQAHIRLAEVLSRSQLIDRVEGHLEKALALAPEDAEAWQVKGEYLLIKERWQPALEAFLQARRYCAAPGRAVLEPLCRLYGQIGDDKAQLDAIDELLSYEPEDEFWSREKTKLLEKNGDAKRALHFIDRFVLQYEVKEYATLVVWSGLMKQNGEEAKIAARVEDAIQSFPENRIYKQFYADLLMEKEAYEKAGVVLHEAEALDPDDIQTLYLLGKYYKITENPSAAEPYLLRALRRDTANVSVLAVLENMHRFRYGDPVFQAINRMIAILPELEKERKMYLHQTAGVAYDQAGDLKAAFSHYHQARMLHSDNGVRAEMDRCDLERLLERVRRAYPSSEVFTKKMEGFTDSRPVFIVGMPRSGTTLTEQVLSSLRGVYGAGELPFAGEVLEGIDLGGTPLDVGLAVHHFEDRLNPSWRERGKKYIQLALAKVSAEAEHIIDKMPHNFQFLGPIHQMLPDAKIVHLRRHPVETCLSAYRILFRDGHYWSDDLKTMGRYYRLYEEMMAHWRSVLPSGVMLEIRYEDMVNDLEAQSRRVAEHIGAVWSPRCLEFYKSGRAVQTASLTQVRQPLYKDSMNRWRKYALYLEPLLEEIDDLVEAYELELAGGR